MASPQRRRPCIPQERRGSASAWPDLPPELLERIVAVLGPRDRVAVRLVCVSWRACVRERFPSDLPFEAPRLLLRRPGVGGGLAFFSLHRRKVLPFALPASVGAGRCCGHTGGWLAMAFDADRSMALCNLVTGQSVAVPPPPVFPVSKVVLSGPPTSPCWIAAALGRTGTVALLQPAVSGAWMTIGVEEGARHGGFRDMAFWSGRLCALGYDGAVLAFRGDLRARAAAVSVLREADYPVDDLHGIWRRRRDRLYLVESDGELLVVRKLYRVWGNGAVDAQVEVQVLLSAGERKWGLMDETPGRAVFVGSVASAVVAVELYPAAGLRESCVYLAQREVEMLAPHAICEYSMEEEEMRGVPIAGGHSADVEPVWIIPFV
ncbi:uncharacterized protein LOC101765120 [Setaria italica]|uniref:uncharacterized protein LOC101765120 n=1 Tax=Setaria italica TaxID=4555 RepID=UPI0003511E08|nr:uncharacterized protein LOC101765120 [Setaria italica]